MKKLKLIRNVLAVLAVLATVVFISCDAFFENEQNVTINLPPISSSARAISSDKISDLKNVTTSYRVTANGMTREGAGGTYTFTLPVGVVAEITVECLNSSGNVIVRAKKTHTVTAGTNNVSINLSRDGDVLPGKVMYNGNGASSGTSPSDEQTYEIGNEVTLQTGEPTRAGYTFAGWTSNVELKYDDAGQEKTIPLGVEFASGGSNVATNIKITSFKMASGGVVLTAKWTPITYTIILNTANSNWSGVTGTITGGQNTVQATYDTPENLPTITAPSVDYAFAGWTKTDGNTTADIIQDSNGNYTATNLSSNQNETINLYPVWYGKRTVLYSDGKFTINELPQNRRSDVVVTKEYAAMKDDGSNYVFSSESDVLWYDDRASITSVEIGSNISPTSTGFWFRVMSNCTSMNLSNLDTSNVTTMTYMFSFCYVLTSLDVSNFDTSKVTDMSNMFNSCSGLTSLDVSNFDTSNVTDMSSMFSGSGLTSLDVSNFDTSNVTDMSIMFSGCSGLTSLDVSNFDTSNVTDMSSMFRDCLTLATIYASSSFVTTSVTRDNSMFWYCNALVGGQNTTYDATNAGSTYARIDDPGSGKPGYFTGT